MDRYNILVTGRDFDSSNVKKGINGRTLISGNIPVETLQQNLTDFIVNIGKSLEKIKHQVASYELDEIEMSIEISANGSIGLIGTIEAGTTGGITLRFKRCDHE